MDLNPEVYQHIFEIAERLWLFPSFLEPGNVIGIFQSFEHFLVYLNGENDRDGFPFACDDFRFGQFRFHGRRIREGRF